MKDYLYEHFFDGIVHIIILVVPLLVTFIAQSNSEIGNITLISLIISIITSFYTAGKNYTDRAYKGNRRVKLFIMLSIIALCFSLCYIIIVLVVHNVYKIENYNYWLDYTIPFIIYVLSVVPYIVEVGFVAHNDICRMFNVSANNYSHRMYYFDLSSARIN